MPGPDRTAHDHVSEFLRQRDKMSGIDRERVGQVHADPGAEPAELLATDLRALLADANHLRQVTAHISELLPDADDPFVHVCDGLSRADGRFTPDCAGCWDQALRSITRSLA